MSRVDQLPDLFRARQKEYLRLAKNYTCASAQPVKSGLIKGAAVFEMCARQLEDALAKDQAEAGHG